MLLDAAEELCHKRPTVLAQVESITVSNFAHNNAQ